MASDLEKLIKNLSGKPETAKKLGNIGNYREMVDSKEGRALLGQLSEDNRNAVKKAADAAAQGNTAAAKALISQVLTTREGAALARQVMDMMGRK